MESITVLDSFYEPFDFARLRLFRSSKRINLERTQQQSSENWTSVTAEMIRLHQSRRKAEGEGHLSNLPGGTGAIP